MRCLLVVAILLLSGALYAAPAKGQPMPRGLVFNLDETDFFFHHRLKEGVDAGAVLDEYIDVMCDAGTKVLMINTNARKANYDSAVWETYWDGYDPNGPDDQPLLAKLTKPELEFYRPLIHSMWALHAQGIDYAARAAARCRTHGVSPWISLRMNDVHFNDDLAHPFHGEFWRQAKYFRGGSLGYYQRALDYAHPEVRELYMNLVIETLERYDADGLELDFMREPYCFREGAEAEGAQILHDFVRDVRQRTEIAATKWGHPVRLAVRVPSHLEVAQGWGLDAVQWAREGLVDLVIPTPRWATTEYDMPLADWKKALAGLDVVLAGGLELLLLPHPGSPARGTTTEEALGAAAQVLADGADDVYVFNYFPSQANWPRADYLKTLRAMNSLEEMVKLPRRHAITWRDITGPKEQYHPQLPATGTALTLTLPTGPKPEAGATVTLELCTTGDEAPTAQINGAACTPKDSKPNGALTLRVYSVPTEALLEAKPNAINVSAAKAVTVDSVAIHIVP